MASYRAKCDLCCANGINASEAGDAEGTIWLHQALGGPECELVAICTDCRKAGAVSEYGQHCPTCEECLHESRYERSND